MMRRPHAIVFLLLLASLPLATAGTSRPDVVAAPLDENNNLLSWTIDTRADAYRIYGATPSGLVLLVDQTLDLSAVVPAGYAGYTVASLQDGAEIALRSSVPPCLGVGVTGGIPPGVYLYHCKTSNVLLP